VSCAIVLFGKKKKFSSFFSTLFKNKEILFFGKKKKKFFSNRNFSGKFCNQGRSSARKLKKKFNYFKLNFFDYFRERENKRT
jgi:hypothetical protein